MQEIIELIKGNKSMARAIALYFGSIVIPYLLFSFIFMDITAKDWIFDIFAPWFMRWLCVVCMVVCGILSHAYMKENP